MTAIPELFEGPNIAHVATLLPDGSPHSVPMWVDVVDGAVAFLCSPGSRKARNLERDERVALSITAHDNPWVMATVRGRVARRVEGDEAWEIIDRIAHKYIGGPYPMREDRVVYLITPEHAWEQAYG
jgi:PPOX class probable F420-dependent enzyme